MFFNSDDNDHFEDFGELDFSEELSIFLKDIKGGEIENYFDLSKVERLTEYSIMTENLEAALELCRYWLSNIPDSIDALNKNAFVLLNLDRTSEALSVIDKAILLSPNDPEPLLMKALILDNGGQHKEALAVIEEVLIINPEEEDYLFAYANILQASGEYRKALDIYLHIVDKTASMGYEIVNLYQEIAFCYNIIGEPEEAVDYYKLALDQDPYDANLWYNLGVIYSTLKSIDDAVEAYEFAVAIDDDFFLAWFNLAYSYSEKEMLDKSISAYEEAIRIKPKDLDSMHNLATVLGDNDQLEKARDVFEEVIELFPNHIPSLYGLGLVHESLREYDKAIEYFDKAISQPEGCLEAQHAKAVLFSKLGRIEEAADAFEKALVAEPKDRHLILDFVRFSFETKQFLLLEKYLVSIKDSFADESEVYPELFFYLSAVYTQLDEIGLSEKYLKIGMKVSKKTINKLNESLQKMLTEFSNAYFKTYRNN